MKLAYAPHRLGGSLIYDEPLGFQSHESRPNMHHLVADTPAITQIIHSTKQSFKHLRPTVTMEEGVSLSADYTGLNPASIDIFKSER